MHVYMYIDNILCIIHTFMYMSGFHLGFLFWGGGGVGA